MQYLRKDVDNKKQNPNNCFLFKMIICVKSEWRFWKKAKAEWADFENKTILNIFLRIIFLRLQGVPYHIRSLMTLNYDFRDQS